MDRLQDYRSFQLWYVLQMDINDLTKPWGLEVDRVELTLESVLRPPDESQSGPLIMPPSVPGLEGLTGPIQQLAMHFLGQSTAPNPPAKGAFTHCESRSNHLVSSDQHGHMGLYVFLSRYSALY